jgi:tetratricopeptide (TPR) repeat protein
MTEPAVSRAEALFRASSLVERRRYGEARTHLASALKTYPDDPELGYLSAYVDYATDQGEAAMRTIQSVLRAQPEHAGARDLYATLLENEKRYAEAESVLIQLLRDYPEDADYYSSYADLMLRTMNASKARRLAQEGLKIEPEHAGCLHAPALADLIEGRGRGESIGLAALVREHPEHLRTSLALVVALQDRGDHRGALRIAQELLRSQPDSTELLNLVRELRVVTHWSLLPLYPMQRWGWAGVFGVWVAGVFGIRLLAKNGAPAPLVASLTVLWLVYIVYSWIWPPLLKKIL